jgi:hypothetical protein
MVTRFAVRSETPHLALLKHAREIYAARWR